MSAAAEVAEFFREHGCEVWMTGTKRRAWATKGLPDLFVMHPKFKAPVAFEVKGPGDRVSQEQIKRSRQWRGGNGEWHVGHLWVARVIMRAAGIL